MDTEIDWRHELDSSFGAGEDLPVGHYVQAGHRAVRRRRAVVSAAGIAAVLVVGLTWTLAPGSAPRTTEAPLATDPSATRSAEPDTTAVDRAWSRLPWAKGDAPVRVFPGSDGPEVRKGAVVHEIRNDLYPRKGTESAAFDVTFEGTRWWVALEWSPGGSAMTSIPAEDGPHDTFDEFVAAAVAQGGMTSGPVDQEEAPYADLADYHGGEVELRPGAVELERVDDPLGLAPERSSVGVVVRFRGEDHWVLLTAGADSSGGFYEKAAESGWLTFDQWLDEQVALQRGEPGLRLVALEQDGTLTPAQPGVEVLDQQADPELEAYGTDVAESSAVALVDWQGARWFVLAVRYADLDADSVTTFAAEKAAGAETIDDFVAFAAGRADEGGLR